MHYLANVLAYIKSVNTTVYVCPLLRFSSDSHSFCSFCPDVIPPACSSSLFPRSLFFFSVIALVSFRLLDPGFIHDGHPLMLFILSLVRICGVRGTQVFYNAAYWEPRMRHEPFNKEASMWYVVFAYVARLNVRVVCVCR